jgi:hypothetical protein
MDTITVLQNQTIYDIANNEYGNIQGVFFLLKDNPETLPNLDAEISPGMKLNIDYSRKKALIVDKPAPILEPISTIYYEIVTLGQSLQDITCQEYGSVEAIFEVMNDNGIESMDEVLATGTKLRFDSTKVVNADVAAYLKGNKIRINTHPDTEQGQGIDFMEIEKDFIVK